jgi:hypothetical protein
MVSKEGTRLSAQRTDFFCGGCSQGATFQTWKFLFSRASNYHAQLCIAGPRRGCAPRGVYESIELVAHKCWARKEVTRPSGA